MTSPGHESSAEAIGALTNETTGLFWVTTETSAYLILLDDSDSRRFVRHPGDGAGSVPGLPPATVANLERDDDLLVLHSILDCRLGRPARFLIDPSTDDASSAARLVERTTTIVCSIRPALGPSDGDADEDVEEVLRSTGEQAPVLTLNPGTGPVEVAREATTRGAEQ